MKRFAKRLHPKIIGTLSRQLSWILLFLVLILFPAKVVVGEDHCAWEDGGYCVETLARETLRVVKEAVDPKTESIRQETLPKLNLPEAQTTPDSLSGGIPYYNFYDTLWSSGLLQDKQDAFEEAVAAGGTKIGGVNLVVLGARTLQKLVDLKFITLEQAQEILNGAKRQKL
jgi:hypothetical protein